MPDQTEIIKINVNTDIPSEIRSVDHISNTQKAAMARRITEGKVQLHKTDLKVKADNELESKFGLIFEVLVDRCIAHGGIMYKTELLEQAGNMAPSAFMLKLNKFVKRQDGGIYILKKMKRNNKVCYQLLRAQLPE